MRRAFPDGHYSVDDLIAEGDKVVLRWTFHATHKGEFLGPAATGKPVTIMGVTTNRIAGGKIDEGWVSADNLGFLQQVGAAPQIAPARGAAGA